MFHVKQIFNLKNKTKMKQETPMQEFAKAVRQWNKDWIKYESHPLSFPKPKNIDDFLAPYLEKEKQAIIDAYKKGFTDNNFFYEDESEDYFNNKYNTK